MSRASSPRSCRAKRASAMAPVARVQGIDRRAVRRVRHGAGHRVLVLAGQFESWIHRSSSCSRAAGGDRALASMLWPGCRSTLHQIGLIMLIASSRRTRSSSSSSQSLAMPAGIRRCRARSVGHPLAAILMTSIATVLARAAGARHRPAPRRAPRSHYIIGAYAFPPSQPSSCVLYQSSPLHEPAGFVERLLSDMETRHARMLAARAALTRGAERARVRRRRIE